MKTLLGIMAVVALLALPAMAVTAPVNVNLTIGTYIELASVPADVLVTLTDGAKEGGVGFDARVYSNVATLVTVGIVQEAGAKGTWTAIIETPAGGLNPPGNEGFHVVVGVTGVTWEMGTVTNVKQATLTITAAVVTP